MAGYWLKMIGTAERPCPDPYTLDYADFARMPRQIRAGDHMILYAVGGTKRVFALAEATGAVRQSGVERWPYRMSIKYLVNLAPHSGIHVDAITTEKREILRVIRRCAGYFRLLPEEYALAAAKLRDANTKMQQEGAAGEPGVARDGPTTVAAEH
jgi:hypothetical protein